MPISAFSPSFGIVSPRSIALRCVGRGTRQRGIAGTHHRSTKVTFGQLAEARPRGGRVQVQIKLGNVGDGVVEAAQYRNLRQGRATARSDQHWRTVDALCRQQRLQDRHVVLAVAIVVVEDALRAVRLQATVAQVHRHIADVLRHPAVQRIGLLAAVADAGGHLVGQCLRLRGDLRRRARLELVGAPHLRPVTVRAGHDVRAELPTCRRPVLRRHRLAALVAPAPLRLAVLHRWPAH
ncbi:hypothetical protein G6F32_013943 [Rhizopus arrhizus]|nr:hypothetical protein G6F32_013943 [Rhizopus arrhizus]